MQEPEPQPSTSSSSSVDEEDESTIDISKVCWRAAVGGADALQLHAILAASFHDVQPFDAQVRHKGQFALRRLYHESDKLIVVLYTQNSCGPCRTLKPVLGKVGRRVHAVQGCVGAALAPPSGLSCDPDCQGAQVVDEFREKIHLVEIDIQKDSEIAQAGGVGGTPTVQFFRAKERLHHLPGGAAQSTCPMQLQAPGSSD